MGKIKIKNIIILVIMFFAITFLPVRADTTFDVIELKSVVVTMINSDEVELNLVTDKPFLTKPILFEKTKNVYFVSLPATVYNGKREVDVSAASPEVKSVTVDFIPYKSRNGEGYTRVIINTTVKPTLKESRSGFVFPTKIVLISLGGLITIILLAYLALIVYAKSKKISSDKQVELDDYSEIEQIKEASDALDILSDKGDDAPEIIDVSPDEAVVPDSETEEPDEVLDHLWDEEGPAETLGDSGEPLPTDIENNVDVQEVYPEIAETEKPSESEEVYDSREILDTPDTDSKQELLAESTDDILPEQDDLPIAPDEIVSDILSDDNVLDEISDTIASDNENLLEDISAEVSAEEDYAVTEQPEFAEKIDDEDNFESVDQIDVRDDIQHNTLEDVLSENSEIEQIQQVDELDEILPDNDEEDEEVIAQDEAILDEILDEETQSLQTESIASEPVFDDILSDNFEVQPENIQENQPESSSSETPDNDFTIADVEQISAGSTGFSNQTFDLTASANDTEVSAEEEPAQDDTVSPFDAFGFESMISGEIEPDNLYAADINDENELTLSEDVEDLETPLHDTEEIIQEVVPEEIQIEQLENISESSQQLNIEEQPVEEVAQEESVLESQVEISESEIEMVEDKQENIELEEQPSEPVVSEEKEDDSYEFEKPAFAARPVDVNSFFADSQEEEEEDVVPDSVENFFIEQDEIPEDTQEEYDSASLYKEEPEEEVIDDSEPIVLDKKDFSKTKSLYLLRHNGEFSLVATSNDNVFVIERFNEEPLKQEIILKHNEKRANDDVYIAKVGSWRALLSVSKDSVKNILTL